MLILYKRVKVTFNLPFALDIPNGLYKVKTDNFFCGVFVKLKQAEDNPSGWQGNPRIPEDRFGHTNYSEILIGFELNPPMPREVKEIEEMYESFALIAINRLLDSIRWITDEFVNHHIIRKDIPSMNCKFFDEDNQELAGSYFSMKSKIRFGTDTSLTQTELEQLKNKLENNERIPFEIELIRNAKDHLKFENYRMVSIEIQNAVEYLMSQIMTKYLKDTENKTDEEIDMILKDFQQLRPILRKATFDTITRTKEFSELETKCSKLRHSVLHRGKQPDQKEAEDALEAGLSFLKILEKYK